MQGSVWEWTSDWYDQAYYNHSAKYNPEGPSNGLYRTLRGRAWVETASSGQPTRRIKYEPWIKRPWVSFRLVSPDRESAKYRLEKLAPIENAGLSGQCGPVQQASIR